MKLISCNANRPLAQRIADRLDMRLTDTEVKTFKDREVFVKVNENVRGQDVYVIQSTSAPANDHLMELLITMDALVRASARRIDHLRSIVLARGETSYEAQRERYLQR